MKPLFVPIQIGIVFAVFNISVLGSPLRHASRSYSLMNDGDSERDQYRRIYRNRRDERPRSNWSQRPTSSASSDYEIYEGGAVKDTTSPENENYFDEEAVSSERKEHGSDESGRYINWRVGGERDGMYSKTGNNRYGGLWQDAGREFSEGASRRAPFNSPRTYHNNRGENVINSEDSRTERLRKELENFLGLKYDVNSEYGREMDRGSENYSNGYVGTNSQLGNNRGREWEDGEYRSFRNGGSDSGFRREKVAEYDDVFINDKDGKNKNRVFQNNLHGQVKHFEDLDARRQKNNGAGTNRNRNERKRNKDEDGRDNRFGHNRGVKESTYGNSKSTRVAKNLSIEPKDNEYSKLVNNEGEEVKHMRSSKHESSMDQGVEYRADMGSENIEDRSGKISTKAKSDLEKTENLKLKKNAIHGAKNSRAETNKSEGIGSKNSKGKIDEFESSRDLKRENETKNVIKVELKEADNESGSTMRKEDVNDKSRTVHSGNGSKVSTSTRNGDAVVESANNLLLNNTRQEVEHSAVKNDRSERVNSHSVKVKENLKIETVKSKGSAVGETTSDRSDRNIVIGKENNRFKNSEDKSTELGKVLSRSGSFTSEKDSKDSGTEYDNGRSGNVEHVTDINDNEFGVKLKDEVDNESGNSEGKEVKGGVKHRSKEGKVGNVSSSRSESEVYENNKGEGAGEEAEFEVRNASTSRAGTGTGKNVRDNEESGSEISKNIDMKDQEVKKSVSESEEGVEGSQNSNNYKSQTSKNLTGRENRTENGDHKYVKSENNVGRPSVDSRDCVNENSKNVKKHVLKENKELIEINQDAENRAAKDSEASERDKSKVVTDTGIEVGKAVAAENNADTFTQGSNTGYTAKNYGSRKVGDSKFKNSKDGKSLNNTSSRSKIIEDNVADDDISGETERITEIADIESVHDKVVGYNNYSSTLKYDQDKTPRNSADGIPRNYKSVKESIKNTSKSGNAEIVENSECVCKYCKNKVKNENGYEDRIGEEADRAGSVSGDDKSDSARSMSESSKLPRKMTKSASVNSEGSVVKTNSRHRALVGNAVNKSYINRDDAVMSVSGSKSTRSNNEETVEAGEDAGSRNGEVKDAEGNGFAKRKKMDVEDITGRGSVNSSSRGVTSSAKGGSGKATDKEVKDDVISEPESRSIGKRNQGSDEGSRFASKKNSKISTPENFERRKT